MSIQGIFFQNQILTPQGLGAFGAAALSDGVLCGCEISGGTMAAGFVICGGRPFRTDEISFGAADGIRVVFAYIDTSLEASETEFEQAYVTAVTVASMAEAISIIDHTRQNFPDGNVNLDDTRRTGWLAVLDASNNVIAFNRAAAAGAMVKLWENDDPTASFAADSVLTIPAAAGYDGFVIVSLLSNGSYTGITSDVFPLAGAGAAEVHISAAAVSASSGGSAVVFIRKLTIDKAAGTFTFSKSWNTAGFAGGNTLIPQAIYGFRAR